MSSFGYLIKEGFKNLVHNRLMTLASIGVLISCLVLTGSAVMLTINVSNIVDSVGDTNVTKVFLDDSYTKLEAVYKGKELSQVANVSQVEFIDKDEAIQAYRDQLGDEVFANMSGDDNPLPYAYSVKMDDLSKYDDTVARIKEVDGVASVSSHREVAEKLTNLSSFITTMSLWIILALAIISLFIISNTIRMTMFSHRFEISIMKSVGATNAFVRVPFIIRRSSRSSCCLCCPTRSSTRYRTSSTSSTHASPRSCGRSSAPSSRQACWWVHWAVWFRSDAS